MNQKIAFIINQNTMLAAKVINGMSLSHLAMAIAVFYLLILLPALVEPKKYKAAMEEFIGSGNTLIRMASVFYLLLAFLILNTRWTVNFSSSRSIMAALGYLLLIKGAVWLWFPNFARKNIKRLMANKPLWFFAAFFGFVIALGLGYLGLWVY